MLRAICALLLAFGIQFRLLLTHTLIMVRFSLRKPIAFSMVALLSLASARGGQVLALDPYVARRQKRMERIFLINSSGCSETRDI